MTKLKLAFKILVVVVVSVLAVEALLEYSGGVKDRRDNATIQPYYTWSLNTLTSGERIGRAGMLKLAIHPFIGYINLPNTKTPYYTINSRGFRGAEIDEDKNGKTRIIVVGGSTAFGTGLNNDSETFSVQLQALLPGTEVINAAVIGHLSGQELAYVTQLIDLQPDLIIAFDGYNEILDQVRGYRRSDFTMGTNNAFFLIENRLRKLYSMESDPLWKRVFTNQSVLFQGLVNHLTELAATTSGQSGKAAHADVAVDEIVKNFVNNTAKMNALAHFAGARFISIRQPHKNVFARESSDALYDAYREFIGKTTPLLDGKGVTQLDMCRPEVPLTPQMFMDPIHLNAEGNRVMAGVAADFIRTNHLITTGVAQAKD